MGWTFKSDDTQAGKLLKQADATMFRATIRDMKIENTATHPLLKLFLDQKRSRKAGWLRKDGGSGRALSDNGTHRIELAQTMFASMDARGLSSIDAIGHALNVTIKTVHRLVSEFKAAAECSNSN